VWSQFENTRARLSKGKRTAFLLGGSRIPAWQSEWSVGGDHAIEKAGGHLFLHHLYSMAAYTKTAITLSETLSRSWWITEYINCTAFGCLFHDHSPVHSARCVSVSHFYVYHNNILLFISAKVVSASVQ